MKPIEVQRRLWTFSYWINIVSCGLNVGAFVATQATMHAVLFTAAAFFVWISADELKKLRRG